MKYILNQEGFQPHSSKVFIVHDSESSVFKICNFITKNPVFEGKLVKLKYYELSGENNLFSGDFSDLHDEGIFYIRCAFNESEPFKIEKYIYEDLLKSSLKFYYFQRSSIPLEEKYAFEWKRNAGHSDDNLIVHESAGRQGTWSAPGGWYDAGDYGKYIVTAAITVQTLLMLYDMFPSCSEIGLNIPESGNGQPDILNEIRFELNWMLKMQDIDGGVFFKTGSLDWTGFVEPSADKLQRYVIGKSTASALSFTIAAAKASLTYRKIDTEFSLSLIQSAEKSWKWAVKNPDVLHPAECGGTGLYPDEKFADKFTSAAIELYAATNDMVYFNYIKDNINFDKIIEPCSWKNPEVLSYYSLIKQSTFTDKKINRRIKNHIIKYADDMIAVSLKSPYRTPMSREDFIWGSNSILLNKAIVLCFAHSLTENKKYLNCVSDSLNYILGFNPCGISFVSGFGIKSSGNFHYRPLLSGKYEQMPPGFLAGGPNKEREDDLKYSSLFPMCSYLDSAESFASNECAINWNAALVFVTGYLLFSSKNDEE